MPWGNAGPGSSGEPHETPLHPIQTVARRTGLSVEVIRAWERRYGAVSPARSGCNRRLYSEGDVRRLLLLRQAILGGRRIGDVARLADEQLGLLVSGDSDVDARRTVREPAPAFRGVPEHLEACFRDLEDLDASRLEMTLTRAALELSPARLVIDVLMPLMRRVGDCWGNGTMRISQEHLATSLVRATLQTVRRSHSGPYRGAEIVVATPAGELHELGALAAAALAAIDGWGVTYLGPNLPATEIADAVRRRRAAALALSIVCPRDRQALEEELWTLATRLPRPLAVLAGGCAASAHAETLERAVGATIVPDLDRLREELARARSRPTAPVPEA